MPPSNIVQNIRSRIHTHLLPAAPARWRKQISFGLQAYGLKAFQSLTGNARQASGNPRTGIRKGERLLANGNLADNLGTVFDTLALVKPSSFVNVDHSDMNGLMALVGALQTRNGRAIPCFVETTYSDRLPGVGSSSSTPRKQALRTARAEERKAIGLTEHTIQSLRAFADRLGFWPRLVFDRGFGGEAVIRHLVGHEATFYIRLKSSRLVELSDGETVTRLSVKELKRKDTLVQLLGTTLRVVRSPKSRRAKEPWYILTNDMVSSRGKIVRIYYHRFEIEETFKDVKHIFEFRRTRLNKPLSLKLLLWFVGLGIALLYRVTKPSKQQTTRTNPKKRISWLRQAYEELQSAYGRLLWEG